MLVNLKKSGEQDQERSQEWFVITDSGGIIMIVIVTGFIPLYDGYVGVAASGWERILWRVLGKETPMKV